MSDLIVEERGQTYLLVRFDVTVYVTEMIRQMINFAIKKYDTQGDKREVRTMVNGIMIVVGRHSDHVAVFQNYKHDLHSRIPKQEISVSIDYIKEDEVLEALLDWGLLVNASEELKAVTVCDKMNFSFHAEYEKYETKTAALVAAVHKYQEYCFEKNKKEAQ